MFGRTPETLIRPYTGRELTPGQVKTVAYLNSFFPDVVTDFNSPETYKGELLEVDIKWLLGKRDLLYVPLGLRIANGRALADEYGYPFPDQEVLQTDGRSVAIDRADEDLANLVGLEQYGVNPRQTVTEYLKSGWRGDLEKLIAPVYLLDHKIGMTAFVIECLAATGHRDYTLIPYAMDMPGDRERLERVHDYFRANFYTTQALAAPRFN